MKTLVASLILALSLIGCVSANLDVQQVVVQHSFTAPNDIPTCPAQYAGYCPTGTVTVNLPPITQNIHFSPPSGVVASVYVDEIDVTSPAGASLDFIQGLTVEIGTTGALAYTLIDYRPSVAPDKELQLFPNDQNLLPYVEGETTTFTVSITGTIPPQEVPLDVTIFLSGDVSYEKSL